MTYADLKRADATARHLVVELMAGMRRETIGMADAAFLFGMCRASGMLSGLLRALTETQPEDVRVLADGTVVETDIEAARALLRGL